MWFFSLSDKLSVGHRWTVCILYCYSPTSCLRDIVCEQAKGRDERHHGYVENMRWSSNLVWSPYSKNTQSLEITGRSVEPRIGRRDFFDHGRNRTLFTIFSLPPLCNTLLHPFGILAYLPSDSVPCRFRLLAFLSCWLLPARLLVLFSFFLLTYYFRLHPCQGHFKWVGGKQVPEWCLQLRQPRKLLEKRCAKKGLCALFSNACVHDV